MTTKEESANPLILASLRATMGDWVYYISFMKMKDVASRVSRAQLFYNSKTLQDLFQRALLKNRVQDIANYLKTEKQRFFNTLVIGTYGGYPKWQEVEIKPNTLLGNFTLPSDLQGVLGFLSLDGSERLFAIDGQHRVEGIREAIKTNPNLGNEEVGVILVKGITGASRKDDPSGFERTRRLFTTLNRYAKPVNKKDIIALDEDDSVAIITRRLVEEYQLFSDGKVSISGAANINISDEQSFTSIRALYDGLDIYLKHVYLKSSHSSSWVTFKRFYPSDGQVNNLYNEAVILWNTYAKYFQPIREIAESDAKSRVAGKYRTSNGGHLLFRPIGLLISLKAICYLMEHQHLTLEGAMVKMTKLPMELSDVPWKNLLWNPSSKKIYAMSINQKAALKLIVYGLGGNLGPLRSNQEDLREELAKIMNKEPKDIELSTY